MIKLILIQGDTFKAITHVKSNTIDLVILDPPYLVTEMPDVTNEIKDVLKKENINWFFLFRELSRVMKENSVLICFGHLSTFMELGRIIKKYFDYVTDIIWVKPFAVNFLKAKLKPLSQHETITVWKKGKLRYNYEEAKEKGEPYSRIRKETEKTSFYNVEYKNSENIGFRYMSDVIYAPHKPDMKFDERTLNTLAKNLYC
jgi:DNA modification methylase